MTLNQRSFSFSKENLQYQENQRFSGPNEEQSSSNALKRQSLLEPRKQEFSLVQQVEHKKTKVFFGKKEQKKTKMKQDRKTENNGKEQEEKQEAKENEPFFGRKPSCKEEKSIDNDKLIEQYVNDLKRVQADFENYIKRSEKEKQELIEYGTHKLLGKLLHVVDEFENAVKVIEKEAFLEEPFKKAFTEKNSSGKIKEEIKKEEVVSGIDMILKQLKKTLKEEGISEIEALGKEFDPYKHESIGHAKGEENKVVEEIKKGYMFKNKILRPSIVKIGQGGK